MLVGGLGPASAPTVRHPWVGPPGASTCNERAAFSSGCGPYLVRMIHGKKARPIQKDGTLQRVLVGGLGPAPTVRHPWVGPPGASTCNEHAAFSSGCGPCLVPASQRSFVSRDLGRSLPCASAGPEAQSPDCRALAIHPRARRARGGRHPPLLCGDSVTFLVTRETFNHYCTVPVIIRVFQKNEILIYIPNFRNI